MYNKDGNTYTPMDNGQFVDNIPVGVYTISDTMRGLVLTQVNDFEMPARLYGNVEAQSARVLKDMCHEAQLRGDFKTHAEGIEYLQGLLESD